MEYYKNLDLADIKYFCEFDLIKKTEQWKDILGYEEIYKVSDLGRIKSLNYNRENRNCILKPIKINDYLHVNLYDKYRLMKTIKIHRLVALMFVPNPDNKPQVNHKKGIKWDNRATSIEWCTQKENNIHAFDNGLKVGRKGAKHHNVSITEKEVLDIRLLAKTTNTLQKDMAKKYNVSPSTIGKIIRRERWQHI